MIRPNWTVKGSMGRLLVATIVLAGVIVSAGAQHAPPAASEQASPAATATADAPPPAQASPVLAPIVPPPPADARAAKAYAVLDEFCARCHQTGRLKIPAPARPLANVLALDEIARDDTLVRPGLPDASPLYTVMLRQHAGIDVDPAPGAVAIQAVRDWIADLQEEGPNCGGRPKITRREVEQAVASSLLATPEEKRRDMRFVTLTHLLDACVPVDIIAGYRQAITKVVNSLSWAAEPIRLSTLGPDDTILRLDLSEIGWLAAHWDKLIQAYPHATLAASRLDDGIRRQTGTEMPAVRGDWLAYAAIGTPLYARLLGLPGRMANLQRILNVEIEADIRALKARRAGLAQSAVTRANRLLERHPTRNGSLWVAYDFATAEGRQNLSANPLGPAAGGAVKVPFRHDATRALFTLPNGFFAYSVNDARGDRIETPMETVDREELGWAGNSGHAAPCMACHRRGPFGGKDAIRSLAEADTAAPSELRDQILALYPPQAEIDTLVSEDQERYAAAQRKVGIEPDLLLRSLEPVSALAREYTRDVGLRRLAAEAGLTMEETRRRLALLPAELAHSGRRVLAARAPRAEADRILIRLAPDGGGTEASVVLAAQPEPRGELELLLWSKSDAYQAGELATFYARSNQNCYLTLVSVDRGGQATVLFPNEFEQNNLLAAGRDMMLPTDGASYQLRLREKGRENLIGICQTVGKSPEGIQHDFERQRFTMLGEWRAHLGQIAAGGQRSQPANDNGNGKSARGVRGRGAAAKEAKAEPGKVVAEQQARTAISYEVR